MPTALIGKTSIRLEARTRTTYVLFCFFYKINLFFMRRQARHVHLKLVYISVLQLGDNVQQLQHGHVHRPLPAILKQNKLLI